MSLVGTWHTARVYPAAVYFKDYATEAPLYIKKPKQPESIFTQG